MNDETLKELAASAIAKGNDRFVLDNAVYAVNKVGGVNSKPPLTTLNILAEQQWQWVERMGWHNKTVLESLALIASEVGEAVNECRGETPTENFGEELADVLLRTLDLAYAHHIDIDAVIAYKMAKNEVNGTRGRIK